MCYEALNNVNNDDDDHSDDDDDHGDSDDDDDAIAGDDGTVESLSTDTRIYRTVSFAPTKTPYVFFNMDNGHFPTSLPSRKLSHLINPALQRTMVS